MNQRDFIAANRADLDRLIADAMPTVEREAASHLAGQRKEVLCISGAEFVSGEWSWLDLRRMTATERDYRRGYLHGYSQAMDDLRAANQAHRSFARAWQSVARFFDGALARWRYDRACKYMTPPPYFRTADQVSVGRPESP